MRVSFWWVCNLSLSGPQRGYASYYNLKVHYAVQRTVLPEVAGGGAEDLLAALLALGVGHAEHVAQKGGVALGVGQLVGVDVANGPDDGLGQAVLVQLQRAQELRRAVIHIHLRGPMQTKSVLIQSWKKQM